MTKTNRTQNHNTTHKNGQPRDIGNIGYTRHMTKTNNLSCVPNVANVSSLSIFMRCVVVLCFVCLRHVSCVPNVPNVARLFVFVMCLVYTMFPMSLGCLSSSCVLCTGTLGTQDTWRRQTKHKTTTQHIKMDNLETLGTLGVLCFVCLRRVSCIPNVPNVSRLFVFVMCLVYPMFPISQGCLSSSCVLCTQCSQCL
jgi:hypothetical protein